MRLTSEFESFVKMIEGRREFFVPLKQLAKRHGCLGDSRRSERLGQTDRFFRLLDYLRGYVLRMPLAKALAIVPDAGSRLLLILRRAPNVETFQRASIWCALNWARLNPRRNRHSRARSFPGTGALKREA